MLGRIAIVTLACVAITARAAGDVNLRGLQQLGVEVKNLADKSRDGYPPSVNDLSGLRRSLRMLQEAGTSADERLRTKYRSVSALLDTLSSPTSRDAAPRSTANRSVERVTETHGSTCATALGISGEHPVAMTLARSGTLGDGAWFKLTSTQHSAFTITTDSTGADPALEVTGGCGGSSQVIAANDDSRGLDSSIVVAPTAGDAFVHVKNTGMAGEVTLSVKQALDSGTLSGQITDGSTGVGIPYAQVLIFDTELYYFVTSLSTDSTGHFSQGLASGDYYVGANAAGFVMQLYPSGLCSARDYFNTTDGCDLSNATPVVVPDGSSTSSINIALSHGHSISGVTRDSNGVPIGNDSVTVNLLDGSGSQLKSISTDEVGHYSFDALPDGNYKVQAISNGAYGSQLYRDVTCSGSRESVCDPARATPIIIAGADAVEIDFHLPRLAVVHGTVTDAAGNPVRGVAVNVYSASGNQLANGDTDALGHYSAGPLDTGEYFVAAYGDSYFSQLFSGYDCTAYCYLELAHGTPLQIVNSTQQATADFQLHPLPVVTGHVQSAVSGQPIDGVAVQAYPASLSWSWFFNMETTDAAGNFSFDDLVAGNYYLWARAPDYIDQMYSGIVCDPGDSYVPIFAPCNLSGATLLTIEPGQTPVSPLFSLSPSASIGGIATTNTCLDCPTPTADARVTIYTSSGTAFRSGETDGHGHYSVSDLPPGTYFAVASGAYSGQYWPQLWAGLECDASCVPTTGTPIVVAANEAIQNVNFNLTREDAILGFVFDSDGEPVVSAIVDLFNTSDLSYAGSTVVDAQGNYAVTGDIGASYYVATEAGSGYVDQIYSGVQCPNGAAFYGTCAFDSATPLTLLASNAGPHLANFVLKRADKIFASGFE